MENMVRNLSQLKRKINSGARFKILEHYVKPDFNGQVRKPNIVQTNGFYSIVDGEPDNAVTLANDGKGYISWYGKASDWVFTDEYCEFSYRGKKIWKIAFID